MDNFQDIYSFDSNCRVRGVISSPDRYRQLWAKCSGDFVPRGAGVSYVLASAGETATSVSSRYFNRILDWNPDRLEIEVEAGVTVGDLLQFLKSHKHWFSVLPGHPSITLGGAVAFNIHGKSQSRFGLISDQVIELKLYHPQYGLITCSRVVNREVFNLTIGGFGLTGFIVAIRLKVEVLRGSSIIKEKVKCRDLREAIEIMKSLSADCEVLYSWNNLNQKGRGWVYIEKFSDIIPAQSKNISFSKLIQPEQRCRPVDRMLRFFLVSHLSRLYEIKEGFTSTSKHLDLLKAAFPFNGNEIYHRFFAQKGLLEYQCIVPWAKCLQFITDLECILEASQVNITLGSLKLFKGFQGEKSYLNFCQEGLCLALDAPSDEKTVALFNKIDSLMVKYEGIPNIAKDSRLSQQVVEQTFGQRYFDFKQDLNNFDTAKIIKSHLRDVLCL